MLLFLNIFTLTLIIFFITPIKNIESELKKFPERKKDKVIQFKLNSLKKHILIFTLIAINDLVVGVTTITIKTDLIPLKQSIVFISAGLIIIYFCISTCLFIKKYLPKPEREGSDEK